MELIDANVQELLLKLPPETLAVHVTVPDGADADPELVSVTVTVNVIWVPWSTDAELGDTTVLVMRLFTVRVDVPELPVCVVSPG